MSGQVGWLVAYTAPRAEQKAERAARSDGYDTYLPVELIRDTARPLFPRYLFVTGGKDWQNLQDIDGIAHVLTNNGRPSLVPADWLATLRAADELGAFDRRPQAQRYAVGDRITIGAGPFKGHSAEVIEMVRKVRSCTAKRRMRVLMSFLGSVVRTEVGADEIEPV